jgi:hypothetical protein
VIIEVIAPGFRGRSIRDWKRSDTRRPTPAAAAVSVGGSSLRVIAYRLLHHARPRGITDSTPTLDPRATLRRAFQPTIVPKVPVLVGEEIRWLHKGLASETLSPKFSVVCLLDGVRSPVELGPAVVEC